jgi:serine/threonine protein kinase/tetratricopeptide (TPR) repeat protein
MPEDVDESAHWSRVKSLVEELGSLPAEQREQFLQSPSIGPQLRLEVEELLALESSGNALFGVTQWRGKLETAVFQELANGTTIGSYRVVQEIGRGGMGAVYLAERSDGAYQQRVALKLLQTGLQNPRMNRRFLMERQILASLVHPGIARLLDGGVTPGGQPFLVLEYVDGRPIDQYCEEEKLDMKACLRLFLKVADVVQAAHQQLVLHLDLKPANILITAQGEPRLLDFGIARLLSEAEQGVSQPSMLLMTPWYASPEQAQGKALGVASDIFSLCTLLYKLLTGVLPYPIEQAGALDAVRMIMEADPRLPSKAAAPAVSASLRGDVDTILMMGLRKEPARRYPTVAALSSDISRFLDSRPVIAHADSLRYRAGKFLFRHRVGVAAACVVLLVTAGSVTAVVRSSISARRERTSALVSAQNAQREKESAQAAAHEAERQRTLAQRSELVADRERSSAETATAAAIRERASAERRLNDIQDLARFYVQDLFYSLTDIPGALPVQKKMADNAVKYLQSMSQERGADPKFSRDLASGFYSMAMVEGYPNQLSLGDRQGSLKLFNMAIAMQKRHQLEDPNDPESRGRMGLMLSQMSNVRNALGDVPGAIALEQQAWEEVQPILRGPKSRRFTQIATYCFFRAVYLSSDGQFDMADPDEALVWIDRAIQLRADLVAEKPEFLKDQNFLSQRANDGLIKALILHSLKRDQEARGLFEQQLAAVDAQAGSTSFDVQKTRHDVHAAYAEFLLATGDLAGAAELAKILVQSRPQKATVGDAAWDAMMVGTELGVWAEIRMRQGHVQEAVAGMKESLEATRQLLAHDPDYQVAAAEHADRLLTFAEISQTPVEEARSMFNEAIPIVSAFANAHPTVLSAQIQGARAHLGLARLAAGERNVAEQRREAAAALQLLEVVVAQRPRLAQVQDLLATARQLQE